MPTDYRSLYDKDYIGAWDLDSGDRTIVITKVIAGQLTGQGGRKSKKPVVYFRGSEKGFALNATNGKTIAALYGNHVENWVGKRITLYKSSTRNPDGSGDVDCIRVRPQVKDGAAGFSEDPVDKEPRISEQQVSAIIDLLIACAVEEKAFLAFGQLEQIGDLYAKHYESAVKWIKQQQAAA